MIDRGTPRDQWPELLRVEEAAALLDVSVGLVYELVRRNDLDACRLGRLVRIPRAAIIERIGGNRG